MQRGLDPRNLPKLVKGSDRISENFRIFPADPRPYNFSFPELATNAYQSKSVKAATKRSQFFYSCSNLI